MSNYNVCFNGRFLDSHSTGVQRVARELLIAFGELLKSNAHLGSIFNAEIISPQTSETILTQESLTRRQAGFLRGALWEQIELPYLSQGQLLVNLCNQAPISRRDGVTMIHDAQVFLSPKSYSAAFRSWYRFSLPRIGRLSRKILTVSEFSKAKLVEYQVAHADKISVIHNGVDHVLRVPADDTVINRLALLSKSYFLGLSNTQAHKNLKVVINAFAREEMRSRTLVLFGGASKADFESVGVSIPPNVKFAGYVNQHELRALYEHACAFVFPSLTEGFGLPPLEAMILGTPAICAPCGALTEVCGDSATYADPHDCGAWASVLDRMASATRPETYNRAQQSRSHAEQYSWALAGSKLAEELISCM